MEILFKNGSTGCFLEDPGLIPSIYMVVHNQLRIPVPGDPTPSSDLQGHTLR